MLDDPKTELNELTAADPPVWRPRDRGTVLAVLHGEGSDPGRIGQLIETKGYRIERRKPRFGCDVPQDLSPYAGVVVFGGSMSSNDDQPWIRAEIAMARQAVAEQVPFLGVCLGAQMLARALGATVAPHPQREMEIGYYPIQPTAAGEALGLGEWPDQIYHWHGEGFALPEGAELLAAAGGAFPNQAFRYGSAVGVQFHPEITYGMVHRWVTIAGHMLALPGAQDAAAHKVGHLTHARRVERWLSRLLDLWLARSLVRAA
jgi:GMP synthase (glutamine-hydrolysing)